MSETQTMEQTHIVDGKTRPERLRAREIEIDESLAKTEPPVLPEKKKLGAKDRQVEPDRD